ncbi:hypothetical protein D0B54_18010 [Solimonas sp. K1W22B-7]|nr:hypothetical protein D0B54_18010 [Solimonas sp. K1W22B-7]
MNDQVILSKKDAYRAMILFLEQEFRATKSEDIAALLSSLQFLPDGIPADPAAWEDWEDCVGRVLGSAGTGPG